MVLLTASSWTLFSARFAAVTAAWMRELTSWMLSAIVDIKRRQRSEGSRHSTGIEERYGYH
ncbi:exported hypothetical protein [Pseudomonas zeae]